MCFIQMGETPLITASYNGHVDIVKTLIEAKAQINTQDEVGISQWHRQGGCFGCSSTPFMPEPRGLGYCYILPEDSADLEHLVCHFDLCKQTDV